MGCDIHLRVQKHVDGQWQFAEAMIQDQYDPASQSHERWYDGRNYYLFAILANVRNGYGFAGCDTGDGFKPISEPRGLPDTVTPYIGETCTEDGSIDDYDFWFGDHSYSWLTLAELLAYDWYQETKCRGWVNGPQFEEWDRLKRWQPAPKESCGGVSGGSVEHIGEQEMRRRIEQARKDAAGDWKRFEQTINARYHSHFCLIEWPVIYSEAAGSFYTRTIPRMIRLAKEVGGPENVRIVFGFDS